jgi:hypothetical protein
MRRSVRVLCLGLLGLIALLAGCDGTHKAIGVFAVKEGMTKQQVQKLAGPPYRAGPNCSLYHASKKGTSVDGMRFCFMRGRVSLIQTSVHL